MMNFCMIINSEITNESTTKLYYLLLRGHQTQITQKITDDINAKQTFVPKFICRMQIMVYIMLLAFDPDYFDSVEHLPVLHLADLSYFISDFIVYSRSLEYFKGL